MTEEAVEPQEVIEDIIDQAQPDIELAEQEEKPQEKTHMVPLSVAQKLREKKKELELELQWERQRNAEMRTTQKTTEEDNSRYESATREDLSLSQNEAIRVIEERMWIRQNPEKYEKITEYLPNFLKQRPNLSSAISSAANRYEEAFTLMEALTPKEQKAIITAQKVKREAPNAPTGVPKSASLNQAVDVMTMSDSEFSEWRKTQKKSR